MRNNFLNVGVAKWRAAHGVRSIPNSDITRVRSSHVQDILEGRGRRRKIGHGSRAVKSVGALSGLKVLPGPVQTIDGSMVEEEEWVTGRRGEVTSWVATDDEVTSGVHAHEVVGKVVRGRTTLEVLPEGLVRLALQQRNDVVVLEPSFAGEAVDVASQAAGVVAQTVAWSELLVGVQRSAGRSGEQRTEVHLPVFERTGGNATTSLTVRNLDLGIIVERNTSESLVGAALGTLTGNRSLGSVKQR